MAELIVLTGLTWDGRVNVKFSDGTLLGSYKHSEKAYKVHSNKKGNYVTIDGKRYYIEIPEGEWVIPEGGCISEWHPKEG